MDLLYTRRVDPVHQSPRTRMYGYFTHGTVPPPRPYSSGFLSLPNRLRRLPSPAHFRRRSPGHAAFAALTTSADAGLYLSGDKDTIASSPQGQYYTAVRLLTKRCSPFRSRL